MMTLAISEHLEKISYLLSLFFPVAVFFLAGLALAWWFWSKHARSLNRALAEHDRVTADLSCAYQRENDLGNRFSILFKKQKKHWEGEVKQREGQIMALTNDHDSVTGDHREPQEKLVKVTRDLDTEGSGESPPAEGQSFFSDGVGARDETLGFLYRKRPAKVDALTKISGIGPSLQSKLNNFGVYQFKQIALWSQGNIDAFSEKLASPGRVERDEWVKQAAQFHQQKYEES